ncbi:hypothetical protein EDB85DRAFT_1973339 [Lactarius pseudohatsudake]|nr:hypothetical protein EDB85DRAFT_1973339 [Lactarius pseudohatsudake]
MERRCFGRVHAFSRRASLALHLAPAHVLLDRLAAAAWSSTSKTNVELLRLHLRLVAPDRRRLRRSMRCRAWRCKSLAMRATRVWAQTPSSRLRDAGPARETEQNRSIARSAGKMAGTTLTLRPGVSTTLLVPTSSSRPCNVRPGEGRGALVRPHGEEGKR